MEPEASVLCSQESAIVPYPGPNASSPQIPNLFL